MRLLAAPAARRPCDSLLSAMTPSQSRTSAPRSCGQPATGTCNRIQVGICQRPLSPSYGPGPRAPYLTCQIKIGRFRLLRVKGPKDETARISAIATQAISVAFVAAAIKSAVSDLTFRHHPDHNSGLHRSAIRRARSRCSLRCGSDKSSPGADVAGVSLVPAQMWPPPPPYPNSGRDRSVIERAENFLAPPVSAIGLAPSGGKNDSRERGWPVGLRHRRAWRGQRCGV